MSDNYDDIINLPHHTSKIHPKMSRQDRAAQFSPFAALTGFENVVKETGRITDRRVELSEEEMAALDERLRLVVECGDTAPEVSITYFQPDSRKSGGSYLTATGRIRKLDELQRIVLMADGTAISINEITDIDCRIFNSID